MFFYSTSIFLNSGHLGGPEADGVDSLVRPEPILDTAVLPWSLALLRHSSKLFSGDCRFSHIRKNLQFYHSDKNSLPVRANAQF